MTRTTIVLRDSDRWVACSAREFGSVGEHRHIVRQGGITSVCGCTASTPAIWRGNTAKPRCKDCVAQYGKEEYR